MDRIVANLPHGEALGCAGNALLKFHAFRNEFARLVEAGSVNEHAQQIRARRQHQHRKHPLVRSRPSASPAVDRLTQSAGEHQPDGPVVVGPDDSFL